MEVETVELGLLDALFTGPIVHITGGPGVGKSLLLLYYLGHKSIQEKAQVLWVDCGGSFPPNRVKALFGRDAPLVLAQVLVAKASSLPHMKSIAGELVSRGVAPGTSHVVLDPISGPPRFALSSTANSAGQGRFIGEDFFAGVVEPLIVAATRDGFQLVFVHEDSQDHPFWWDRYPARENRIQLKKDRFNSPLREIYDGYYKKVATINLTHKPIRIIPSPAYMSGDNRSDEHDD